MNTTPEWVTVKFKREELHNQPIVFKDDSGRQLEGHLEVEKVNERGQMVIRVCYNPGAYSGTVMLTAFRLTQQQADALQRDGGRCVLHDH